MHHHHSGLTRRWSGASQRGEVRQYDDESFEGNQVGNSIAFEKDDARYMAMAVEQAREAYAAGEVPVGAILVDESSGQVIARARNRTEEDCDPTSHAEMACIRHASKALGRWRLVDCTLYVTLEPCPMCAGAILQSRLGTVVYGAPNKLLGADGSWIHMLRGRQSSASSLDDDGWQGKQSKLTSGCSANCCKEELTNQQKAHKSFTATGLGVDSNQDETGPISTTDARSHPFHPNIRVRRGVLEEQCAHLMKMFFKQRRLSSNPAV